MIDDPANVGREERCLADLHGSNGAADTFKRFAYDEVTGRGRRVSEAGGLVSLVIEVRRRVIVAEASELARSDI